MARFVLVFSTKKMLYLAVIPLFSCQLTSAAPLQVVGNLEWALVQPGRSPIPKFDTMGITTNSLGRRANRLSVRDALLHTRVGAAGAGANAADVATPADAESPTRPKTRLYFVYLSRSHCVKTRPSSPSLSTSGCPTSSTKLGSVPCILRVLHGRRSCITSISRINRRITGFISYLS